MWCGSISISPLSAKCSSSVVHSHIEQLGQLDRCRHLSQHVRAPWCIHTTGAVKNRQTDVWSVWSWHRAYGASQVQKSSRKRHNITREGLELPLLTHVAHSAPYSYFRVDSCPPPHVSEAIYMSMILHSIDCRRRDEVRFSSRKLYTV